MNKSELRARLDELDAERREVSERLALLNEMEDNAAFMTSKIRTASCTWFSPYEWGNQNMCRYCGDGISVHKLRGVV
jgi:hypothetical protein